MPRVTYRCPGDIGSCLDAALRDAGAAAGTHVWLVARQRGMLLELRSWSESRLEPGQPREFNHVYVERRRLRP